ncbi:MAG: hypothetical protein WBK77_05130 [Alphaproteobacteria bacterium]
MKENFTALPKAWVVFSGHAELPWLKILRPGFRHCFALLNDGERWITVDPLSNYTDINVHDFPSGFDLPSWIGERGLIVIRAHIRRTADPAPWMPYSCVEAVKRILGLHARLILTPWQLYRHLLKTPQHEGEFSWEH